jgi:biopolymer transport protein ExbB/TolQ
MKLLSSSFSHTFVTLNELVSAVNEFADDQEYAIVKKRIKNSKKEVLRKVVLRCDKDENFKSQEFEKRKTSTRACECSFEVVTTLESED